MKYLWICDNQIVGYSETQIDPVQYPTGFELVAYEGDRPQEELYWDGTAIQERPERPDDFSVWDGDQHQWVGLTPILPAPQYNWAGLEAALRGSTYFSRAYEGAKHSLWVNRAFTLFLTTLSTTHNLDDLRLATVDLRAAIAALAEQGEFQDFSDEELEAVRQLFETNGFTDVF